MPRPAETVFGDGAGVVVLKRLEDAIASRDSIYAVIKGFALNNDGSGKVAYSAPSASGQAEVIALAQEMAGFQPETITCIEAHGTATPMGDPIEMAGLIQAFRSRGGNYCAIGSVKTNVGHLEVAAGVCGLIKMALSSAISSSRPASISTPRTRGSISRTAPSTSTASSPNGSRPTPRRGGVSSFGVGGTNAHVVLEEAAEGGIAAAMGNVYSDDNWKVHFRDTMRGGKLLNHWRMAELHAQEAPDRVRELEDSGVRCSTAPPRD